MRGILAMGRRQAEALMRDTCRITSDGETSWDEEKLDNVTGPRVTVYEGKCRLLSPYRAPTTASTPGQVQAVQLSRLSLPVADSLGVTEGMEVEYLTSESDPDLPGKTFRIGGGAMQSDATARRLPLESVS
jgi:hypothetical protein